ncbi:MAG: dihydropteroate synthase [Planctomycetales bacterium]
MTPTKPLPNDLPTSASWNIRGGFLSLDSRPLLMGIVNATPDSFSDGGRFLAPQAAVTQALTLIQQGAAIIDVGGESTRPGSEPVPVEEELRRVIPVIRGLAAQSSIPISIDTTKGEVAREALAAGATIVNDISGLAFDPQMATICAESGAGVICMHIQGTPATMQGDPRYADVVQEVRHYLERRLSELEQLGIPRERVVLDPGIGFGKTAEHNLALLSRIDRFRDLGRPVCIGHSRKRFLKRILGQPLDEGLWGTVGVAIAVALQGADLIRVHDVGAVHDALRACRAVLKPEDYLPQPLTEDGPGR